MQMVMDGTRVLTRRKAEMEGCRQKRGNHRGESDL